MGKERRLRFLVNEFQGKLLRRFTMYWLIYQFTVWNILFFWQVLTEGKGNVTEQYIRFASKQYPMLLCVIVLIPFFAWDALKFSLRVAGPLHRIQSTIQAIKSGRKIRPVTLREGDYLQNVIDDLNSLVLFLDERHLATVERAPAEPRMESSPDSDSALGAERHDANSEAIAHAV